MLPGRPRYFFGRQDTIDSTFSAASCVSAGGDDLALSVARAPLGSMAPLGLRRRSLDAGEYADEGGDGGGRVL